MYEELIKSLREAPSDWYDAELHYEAADAIEELNGYLAEAERDRDEYRERLDKTNDMVEKRWIPVTERLPEKRKWVLCRCEAGITDVLRYENAEWYHDPTHVYFFDFVTHWMPLPGNYIKKPKQDAQPAKISDSGERTQFESGAVRDMSEGKGRERNWEKGIPAHSFLDSAFRHLAKYADGATDEDHLIAAVWNLCGLAWTEEKRPDLMDIPARRNDNG